MELILIRHGRTAGNLEGRYIGVTDEPLCVQGRRELECHRIKKCGPVPELVVTSPMLRCRETAELLFSGIPVWQEADFRECDFGFFEGKNYQELCSDPDYQRWIDSNGILPFPAGEAQEQFRTRCCRAFEKVLEELFVRDIRCAAAVVHGGTIMSILERYGDPEGSFYDWQAENGGGYYLETSKDSWTKEHRIRITGRIHPTQGKEAEKTDGKQRGKGL